MWYFTVACADKCIMLNCVSLLHWHDCCNTLQARSAGIPSGRKQSSRESAKNNGDTVAKELYKYKKRIAELEESVEQLKVQLKRQENSDTVTKELHKYIKRVAELETRVEELTIRTEVYDAQHDLYWHEIVSSSVNVYLYMYTWHLHWYMYNIIQRTLGIASCLWKYVVPCLLACYCQSPTHAKTCVRATTIAAVTYTCAFCM